MDYHEALKCKGKKVSYEGEEYILMKVFRKQRELMKGVPNPFMSHAFDAILFHQGRNAARIVAIEHITPVPEEKWKRRMQFGDSPGKTAEELQLQM